MPGRPAFALLHGGGQGSWVWDDVAGELRARGADVLALDIPGCGTKRGVDAIGYGVDETAAELVADIEAAGLSDAILVGHSQAGTMLPMVYARKPGLFRRLVYLSCCAPVPGQSVIEMMGRGVHGANPAEVGWPLDPDHSDRDLLRREMFCNDMDPALAGAFLAQCDQDMWPPGVTYATHWRYDHLPAGASTYILCERDQILPPDWQSEFARRLHCDRTLRIDAGHQAMNTQPERLADMLLAEAAL